MGIFVPSITVITSDVTVTVGVTGDFTNLNDALAFLRTMQPVNNAKGFVTLLSGFVLREQIIVDNRDLSWITISAQDASVSCDVTYLTTPISGLTEYPLFYARSHGALPIINFSVTGGSLGGHSTSCAMAVESFSYGKINSGKGFTNFQQTIFSRYGGFIDCHAAVLGSTTSACISASQNGNVNADSATITSASIGVIAAQGSAINLTSANITTGVGFNGIQSTGGDVSFGSGVINGGATAATDLVISQGGIIRSPGSVAGSASAFNTLTANGIIYR